MFLFSESKSSTVQYDRLEDASWEEKANLALTQERIPQVLRRLPSNVPWMISTTFFALLSIYLALTRNNYSASSSFENGFSTDLSAARHQISIQQVRFDGSPSFTADGEEYVPEHPGESRYVGEPSDEVDDAWNQITKERYFLLSEEEAQEAWGPQYKEFWNEGWGGYLAGFDMFHTLHCLDHLRQAFYPDHYPQTALHGKLHNEHCIDHIRQMIQCYGDITPIPSRYYPGIGQNYIDSDQVHTCRNFGQLRAWVSERYNGSLAVEPKFRGMEGGKHGTVVPAASEHSSHAEHGRLSEPKPTGRGQSWRASPGG